MNGHEKRLKHNRQVQKIRKWRNSRTRPHAKGVDRAEVWAKKPLSIWPTNGGRKHSGFVNLEIPKRFSMIENPDETLAFLLKLRNVVGSDQVTDIHIDHTTCDHTDLCASVLM